MTAEPQAAGVVAPANGQKLYDEVAQASAAAVIKGYSTSFGLACRLLKEPVRARVRNIYALVRLADEIVDGPIGVQAPQRAGCLLSGLEDETYEALWSGYSTNLVVHAFALTSRECSIGPDLVMPFFASMRADLRVREHDRPSFEDYVYGSAEVVGLMCLRAFLAGGAGTGAARGEQTASATYDELAPGARRLGAAFQKVNFLRDLAADHDQLGRTYFPGLRMEEFCEAHRDELLDEIDDDLGAAARAIDRLPASSRRAVATAHGLFAELSGRLRRTPAAEIKQGRVRVPAPAKARVVAGVLLGGARA